MIQEDRELLLKDLCARLPYGVICTDNRHGDSRVFYIDVEDEKVYYTDFDEYGLIENCKPYLRPVSDVTEDEIKYITDKCGFTIMGPISDDSGLVMHHQLVIPVVATELLIDFYNSHHIDWRGMIEKGLALKATEGMYNIK